MTNFRFYNVLKSCPEDTPYGCNELLFHPHEIRGFSADHFTPLFRPLPGLSNIRFTSKITVLSYIGTYYAIGAAWLMTTGQTTSRSAGSTATWTKYYIDSWKVWFSIVLSLHPPPSRLKYPKN